MITTNNYYSEIDKIGISNLPPTLKETHEFINEATNNGNDWGIYKSEPEIKEVIDLYLAKLNKEYSEEKTAPAKNKSKPSGKKRENGGGRAPKTHKVKRTAKKLLAAKSKSQKSKPSRISPDAEAVEAHSLEYRVIKRYVNLHEKIKNKNQIRLFIKYIQDAITEKRLTRKTAQHPNEINHILTKLITFFRRMGDVSAIELNPKDLNKYLGILGNEYRMLSVGLIKSYLNLQGKEIEREKARRLYNRIGNAINMGKLVECDKYWRQIKIILKSLKEFVKTKGATGELMIHKSELNGLNGIIESCHCENKGLDGSDDVTGSLHKNTIMNSRDIINLEFDKIGFTGKWLDFIGDPAPGFTAMVFGKPKMGKSYLAVEFSGYLARNHGRVLYVAKEEGIDDTLQKKLKDKDVAHENLFVSDYLPDDLSDYDYVFLDSVTKLKLSPEDLDRLRDDNPGKSFIFIFQVTKNGIFRGANDFAHDMDVLIEVPEKGLAVQNGRYNQGEEMEIFQDAA